MSQRTLCAATTDLLETYGKTAHNVIEAYRAGGERVAGFVDQRWAKAVDSVGARLAADVRLNALSAQRKVSSLYTRGVRFSTGGADAVVHKAVVIATQGVRQAAASAEQLEHMTGFTRLGQVADAALPAVEVVQRVATQLEVRSHRLAKRMAGRPSPVAAVHAAPTAKRASAARKSRARKTA